MARKILITGNGTAGSWKCRGEQLGRAAGGSIKPLATAQDCKDADLIVVVKRIHPDNFRNIISSGKPWVWDLVDLYPQPTCSKWSKDEAIQWIRRTISQAKPDGIIWPNAKMKVDCDFAGEVIYHHSRKSKKNFIRQHVKYVGYEGCHRYLGKWRQWVIDECNARGWEFREDLPIADLDVVVAFRDNPYNGYVQKNWKSNVKLANAHGTGTPFVGQPEAGYHETACGYEEWALDHVDLKNAFDKLTPFENRLTIHEKFIKNEIKLADVARQYRGYCGKIC